MVKYDLNHLGNDSSDKKKDSQQYFIHRSSVALVEIQIDQALHPGTGRRPEVLNHGHALVFDRCGHRCVVI